MEEILTKTTEKEEKDNKSWFKVKLFIALCVIFVLLLVWLLSYLAG